MRGDNYPEIEDLKEINVIPLVDVMLVLLVIFMATAPLTVGGLAVKLPVSSVKDKSMNTLPLVISISKDGKYFVEKDEIAKDKLLTHLRSIFSYRESKNVYIKADNRVQHGTVVHALSAAKQAGAIGIKILTKVAKSK